MPRMSEFQQRRLDERRAEQKAIREEWFRVVPEELRERGGFQSLKGDPFRGIITTHIKTPDGLKTLCGRSRGQMSLSRYRFDPTSDCQRCRKAALKLSKVA